MKKTLLVSALAIGVFTAGNAFAGSFSLGNVKVNAPTMTTKTTTATTAAKSANAAKIESQINALNNKLTSVSSTYKNAVNNIVSNLVTGDELKEYKEKVAKLKADVKSGAQLNIDIAEDGTVAINNTLKNISPSTLKNLSSTKKAAIQNSLNTLKSTANSYTSIKNEAQALAKSIKADPMAALANAPELVTLSKNAKEAASQAKNITKLSSNIVSAFSKAGIKLTK